MVNALADDVREEDLRRKFEKYGEVGDCFVPRFRDSGRCRGFGFVRFVKEDDMEYALESLEKDPVTLFGRQIRAEKAKQRPRPGVEGWREEGKPVPTDPRNDRRRSRSRDRYRSRSRDRYSRRDRDRSPPRRRRTRSRSRSRDRRYRR